MPYIDTDGRKRDGSLDPMIAQERQMKRSAGIHPSNCPHCEYDRRFPGFEAGGWMQQGNNGPIVPCPLCNDAQAYPRS